jgi:signal transduction histidine kinase
MATTADIPGVLIIDDRPDKRVAFEAVLSDLGLRIVTVESGRSALKHLLHEDFAVILLDVQMPGMDGFETAALIRQRKNLEHTPIIFLTSYGDDMHVARGYSLGAVDFILAPVVPEILRTKVMVFIELYRKTDALHRHAEQWQRRARQLKKLNEASLAINSALGMNQLLRLVVERGVEIFGARRMALIATFGIGRSQTCKVVAPVADGQGDDEADANALEMQWLSSAAPDRVISLADGAQHDRYLRLEGIDGETIDGLPAKILIAPLVGRDGRNIGVMVLIAGGNSQDAADDEALFMQFAQTTSVAIENTLFANAREANRLKDEFLATLSHELRTPLTAILGWVQLLRLQTLGPKETAHGLEIIERSVSMQTKLIEDLLDISRIVAGKLRLNMQRTDFRSAVQAAVEVVRPQVDAKQLHLELQLGTSPAMVQGDPERLQQVVWNLLSNAVKFTPCEGRMSVELDGQDGQIELRVSDTGQGISGRFLPHVFDRFWQADSTTTRSHGGLGIGLALVRHVVESHGGSVAAESEGEGQGSQFFVRLPLSSAVNGDSAETPSDSPATESVRSQTASLLGVRALIVEDQPESRDVLTRALNGYGAETVAAGTAAEAISLLDRLPLDLLVSDIGLPEMDGYALMRHLRRATNGRNAHIPAIALTALAHEGDKQLALRAGYNVHLAKPVDLNDLARIAASLVKVRKPPVSAAPVPAEPQSAATT